MASPGAGRGASCLCSPRSGIGCTGTSQGLGWAQSWWCQTQLGARSPWQAPQDILSPKHADGSLRRWASACQRKWWWNVRCGASNPPAALPLPCLLGGLWSSLRDALQCPLPRAALSGDPLPSPHPPVPVICPKQSVPTFEPLNQISFAICQMQRSQQKGKEVI